MMARLVPVLTQRLTKLMDSTYLNTVASSRHRAEAPMPVFWPMYILLAACRRGVLYRCTVSIQHAYSYKPILQAHSQPELQHDHQLQASMRHRPAEGMHDALLCV